MYGITRKRFRIRSFSRSYDHRDNQRFGVFAIPEATSLLPRVFLPPSMPVMGHTYHPYASPPALSYTPAELFSPHVPEYRMEYEHPIRRIECRWGIPCHILLDDLSPAGIARHLKQHHFEDENNRWNKRARGHCAWEDDAHPCHRDMFYASFGKHIAAVHLGAITRQCIWCGRNFVRPDTLDRHMKRHCPKAHWQSSSCLATGRVKADAPGLIAPSTFNGPGVHASLI